MSDSFHRSLDTALAKTEEYLPAPESCTAMVDPGSRWGASPYPPEFCEEDAVPGTELCEGHTEDYDPDYDHRKWAYEQDWDGRGSE